MIALLFAAALTQVAPPEPKLDCSEPQNTLEINDCGAEALSRDQEQMAKYLEAALIQVRKELEEEEGVESVGLTEEIVASQQAFEDYAEKACAAVYTRWQAGTIRVAMALGCQRELVLQRTRHLWREYLTAMDSSDPVLPEPKPFEWPKPASPASAQPPNVPEPSPAAPKPDKTT